MTSPTPQPVIERVFHKLGGYRALGSDVASEADLARIVDRGIRLVVLGYVQKAGFSKQEIERLIIPARTWRHRKVKREPLSTEESDRVRKTDTHPGSGGGRLRRCRQSEPMAARRIGNSRWQIAAGNCADRGGRPSGRAAPCQARLGRSRVNAFVAAIERAARTRFRRRLWPLERRSLE